MQGDATIDNRARGGEWTGNSCTIRVALCIISPILYILELEKVHHAILHRKFNHPKPKFHIAYMLKSSIKTTQKSYSKYIHLPYLKLAVSLCSI